MAYHHTAQDLPSSLLRALLLSSGMLLLTLLGSSQGAHSALRADSSTLPP